MSDAEMDDIEALFALTPAKNKNEANKQGM